MTTEQITRTRSEEGKPADEDVAHVQHIDNTGGGLDVDTKVVQDVGEDGPGVHHHVSIKSCWVPIMSANHSADELEAFLVASYYVFSLGRLADSPLPLW